MELTNLIWHLGAAIAALWAGFAYRGLRARYADLTESVLPSVLRIHTAHQLDSGGQALSAKERSSRVRALRWLVSEFGRHYGIQCTVDDQQSFVLLATQQWLTAFSQLFECSQGLVRLPQSIFWQDENGVRMTTQAFAEFVNQFKLHGQKNITLSWNEEACEGQGGWQWRVS